jgi:hypothetical protein
MQHYAETDADYAKNRIIPGALPVGLCGISTRHGDDTHVMPTYCQMAPAHGLHESLVHRQAAASC